MLAPEKFEDKVALTGIGMSEIGRRLMVPPLSLTVAACEAAVADAGLTFDDIDGLSTYPGGGNLGGFGEGGVTSLEAALGLRPTWYNGGIETFGPGGSLIAAMLAVAGGLARHVLCFRTLWEATFAEQLRRGTLKTAGSGGGLGGWMHPFGATSAAHTLAQNAQRHFHKYGTTRETLGWIALNQRANSALHPTAIYTSACVQPRAARCAFSSSANGTSASRSLPLALRDAAIPYPPLRFAPGHARSARAIADYVDTT